MRSAIQNYEERHGLVKEKKQTTEDEIHRRLRKIMNPLAGLDIERTNLVKDVQLQDGIVHVEIDLPPDHQFSNSIKEEIKEKIEPLWDIKEVVVKFIA